MKKIDKVIQFVVKWYCNKRGITVFFFMEETHNNTPSKKLFINGNGNIGI